MSSLQLEAKQNWFKLKSRPLDMYELQVVTSPAICGFGMFVVSPQERGWASRRSKSKVFAVDAVGLCGSDVPCHKTLGAEWLERQFYDVFCKQ